MVNVLKEFHRVLTSNGHLLITYHIGDEIIHTDDSYAKPVDLDFSYFQTTFLEDSLLYVGFEIEENLSRAPYEEVEHPSQRGYLLTKKI